MGDGKIVFYCLLVGSLGIPSRAVADGAGLTGLHDASDETLDFDRVLECFEKAATLPSKTIIERLMALADMWRPGDRGARQLFS